MDVSDRDLSHALLEHVLIQTKKTRSYFKNSDLKHIFYHEKQKFEILCPDIWIVSLLFQEYNPPIYGETLKLTAV